MAKNIEVGLRFYDLGNSLQQISKQFSEATSGKGLSQGLLADIKGIENAANEFNKKIQGTKDQKVSIIDVKSFIDEGEQVKQRLISLIKETQQYYRSAGIGGELSEQLDKVGGSIDRNDKKLQNFRKVLSEVANVSQETKSQLAGIQVAGLGRSLDTEKIDSFVTNIRNSITKLKQAMTKEAADGGTGSELYAKQAQDLQLLNSVLDQATIQQEKYHNTLNDIENTEAKISKLKIQRTELEKKGKDLTEEEIRVLTSLNTQLDVQETNLRSLKGQLGETNKEIEKSSVVNEKTRESMKNMITQFFSFQQVLMMVRRVIHQGVQAVQALDKSFTEIAMVTSYTNKEVWKMKDSFLALAETTGLTVTEVSKLSVEFFRQGRSLSEVIQLTEAAGIAAKLAGIGVADSVRYLTSAVNGYKLGADQAMAVSDKFASLAAASATDYEELATALSKVASQAYSAGVGMDNMLAFIAKALETTREAPENIGTAFKTIFARMQEIKDYGKTLEDGMDVNRVEGALNTIGVALRNQAGELRNLDEVLIDTGKKWPQLTKNQKAYIATALAGTRQQTRLLAVFEDFDRTLELSQISAEASGASYAQMSKYYNSMEYAITKLNTAWQEFVTNLVESDFVITITNGLTLLVKVLNDLAGNDLGQIAIILTGITYAAVGLNEALTALKIKDIFTSGTNAITGFLGSLTDIKKGFIAAKDAGKTFKQAKDLINKSSIVSNAIQEASNRGADAAIIKDKLLTAAELQKKAAVDAANVSLTAQIGILLANPWTWVAIAVAAVAGAMIKMSYDANKANGSIKNLEKTTRDYAATAYNSNKKISDIESLTNKYNDLAGQINLTSEEEQQMLEYAQQIQDLAGEKQVLTLEGDLNTEAINEIIKETSKELNKTVQDTYQNIVNGLNRATYTYDELDAVSKEYYQLGEAMKILRADTKEEFDAMSTSAKDYAKTLAAARAEASYSKKVLVTEDNIATANINEASYQVIPTLDEEALKQVENTISESVYGAWNSSSAIEMATMLKNIENTFGNDEVGQAQMEIVKGMLKGSETIEKIVTMFGSEADRVLTSIGTNLDRIDETLSIVEGFNLSDEGKKLLTGSIIELGPIEGFAAVADQLNLSFTDTLAIASKLNELEFNNINTADTLAGLKSISENYTKLAKMLSGEEDFDITALKNAVMENSELAKGIANNGKLAQSEIKTAIRLQEDAAVRALELEIAGYENDIAIAEKKKEIYQALITEKTFLEKLGLDGVVALNEKGIQALYDAYVEYEIAKTKVAVSEGAVRAKAAEMMLNDETLKWEDAVIEARKFMASQALGFTLDLDLQSLEDFKDESETAITTAEQYINAQIKALDDSITQFEAFIAINKAAISGIENGTLYFEELTEAVEDLAAAMTEVERIIVEMSSLESAIELLKAQAENLSGEALIQNLNTQIKLSQDKLDLENKLIDAYKRSNSTIMEQINNNGRFANSIKFENGRLVTTEQFLKLSKEERDVVNNLIEGYNDNADAINESQIAIENELKAMKDANDQKLKMIDETKQLIIDARKEELQAQLDKDKAEQESLKETAKVNAKIVEDNIQLQIDQVEAAKKRAEEENDLAKERYETEKDFIDKTKALYQEAFKEEDYTDSLQELSNKREDIINQIAALEGATDLASLKKREDLLKEKADLDKEYNTTVRDYNRDALLESLDAQAMELEAAEEARQKEYDILQESYDNKIEGYEADIDANDQALDAQIQNIDDKITELEKTFADMTSAANLEQFAAQILQGSSDALLNYLQTNSEEYVNSTIEAKQLMLEEWKDYVAQTKEILGELSGAPIDYGKYLDEVEGMLKDSVIGTGTNADLTQQTTTTSAPPADNGGGGDGGMVGKNARATGPGRASSDGTGSVASSSNSGKVTREISGRPYPYLLSSNSGVPLGWYKGENLETFLKGGLADFTGPAWLDGSPNRPERILSPVQTELFDSMVSALEKLSMSTGSTSNETISIGNITIQTPQLNTNADFSSAGRILAAEFRAAINERGLNINKKR